LSGDTLVAVPLGMLIVDMSVTHPGLPWLELLLFTYVRSPVAGLVLMAVRTLSRHSTCTNLPEVHPQFSPGPPSWAWRCNRLATFAVSWRRVGG
jgi:hypothetical protein